MELHKLLSRQVSELIPESMVNDAQFVKFLQAVNESYLAYEKEIGLSGLSLLYGINNDDQVNSTRKEEATVGKGALSRLDEAIRQLEEDARLVTSSGALISVVEYVKEMVAKTRQTENTLTQNVKRITSLINNLNSGVLVENENREIVFTNDVFCRMFGIPAAADQLVGADCSRSAEESKGLFKYPQDFINGVNRLLQRKELIRGEVLELADGRFFERDFVPVYLDDQYKGHLWNYTDVSERKKAESVLEAREEKYRSIITNMNLGLLEVDAYDNIQFCNQSFMDISGYTLEELKGKNAASVFATEQGIAMIREKQKLRLEGKSDSYELVVRDKHGNNRWWLISGAPNQNDKGEFIGTIGIHLDITEQKKMERELEVALQKSRIAANAKESFLANMSHEIRTPLNAIIGMIRELRREDLTSHQKSYLSNCETAAKHLLSMVNNILDMSRIEAGEVDFEKTDFSMDSVIDMVHSILYIKAREKDLKLITNVAPDISPALIGDSGRIRQVLINILGNAIKFTEKGSVELSVNVIGASEGFQTLSFLITDTGIGMTEEFLSAVFDKFSREREDSFQYEGTGLGMNISREIVSRMGGSMHVKSEKNAGTSVQLILSFAEGDTTKLTAKRAEGIDGRLQGLHCLLVEDNAMNRLIAGRSLQFFGCTVTEAENGQMAIDLLRENKFDFVLMDIQMPVINGVDATRYIREKLNISIPVIALTANVFKSDIDLYISAGMNDFVTKPFDEINLFNVIAGNVKNETGPVVNSERKLFDLSKIKMISRGDEKFIKNMLSLFVKTGPESVKEMNEALKADELGTVARIIHRIKPSLDNLGMEQALEIAVDLEQHLNSGSADRSVTERLVNELEINLGTAIRQFSYLN